MLLELIRRDSPSSLAISRQVWRLALCAFVLTASAVHGEENWLLERRERTFSVSPATAISFENPFGNVHVRVGEPEQVYVLVNSQRDQRDPRTFDLATSLKEGSFEMRAVAVGELGEVQPETGWNRHRADFTLFVPPGAATHFVTEDGLIEVRGTRAKTRLETETGEMRLRLAGPFEARSVHGDVLLQLVRTDFEEASEITTSTGQIRVALPIGAEAHVDLETRGEITTDYSIEIDRSDPTRKKRGVLRTGPGKRGPRLSLSSSQGEIHVVEMLVRDPSTEKVEKTDLPAGK